MNKKYLVLLFGVTWCNLIIEAQKPERGTSNEPWGHPFKVAKVISAVVEHITEPITLLKGKNRSMLFRIPKEYMAHRYQKVDLIDRSTPASDVEEIYIKPISLPDISFPSNLRWQQTFSVFLPLHRQYAAQLIEIFLGLKNIEDFISASVFCRERINPYLFVYSLSVAMAHRQDTKDLGLPSLAEIFPEKFLDRGVFPRARREANVVPLGSRIPIEIPMDYTASNLEPEHRVAYFREDVGINLGHWYWHITYPSDGPTEVLNKDRAGELFYYYHQQIVSRYNFERLCNNLGKVERFHNWHEPIKEGYFPKLDKILASRVWPARQAYSKLKDINREMDQLNVEIQQTQQFQDRIYDAIHQGAAVNEKGDLVPFTEATGMNILGHMVISTALSVNRPFYGGLHNAGHILTALMHDPDGRYMEDVAVMGDTAVAMRDPIFYRWHKYIDDIFQEYKNTLQRYTVQQLDYPGVTIKSLAVQSRNAPVNEFVTFWQKSDIDLYKGLDFAPRGSVLARVTHLQHTPFVYQIVIHNTGPVKKGTVRIFMAPMFDERGQTMLLRDQRHHFIELDHFAVNMYPGNNKYERHSFESSVTFPLERTFTNLNSSDPQNQEGFAYCGCGWPQHMLIPKGKPEGYPAELFVMVSDFNLDNVEQPPPEGCRQPYNYCGWRQRKYPDKRAMGYPFDRDPRPGASTLKQFLTPNMKVEAVKIKFTNKIISEKKAT